MAGRFQPGKSGKPKGSRNHVLAALDQIGSENAEAILREAVKMAIGDEKSPPDLRAAELILSRVWPARKGRAALTRAALAIAERDLAGALLHRTQGERLAWCLVRAVAAQEGVTDEWADKK
jgi:hypothetical protein